MEHENFMRLAIEQSRLGMQANEGGPFGAIVVKNGQVIGKANNQVIAHNDPTAHAEVQAIRQACATLGSFQLDGCVLYTSCEPCPMCLGAIYWARPDKVYYANTRSDAAEIEFDDELIYEELGKLLDERTIKFVQIGRSEALEVFREWTQKTDRTAY
jgi:tRNA(Arg) A34 adenosine deaminase TadA